MLAIIAGLLLAYPDLYTTLIGLALVVPTVLIGKITGERYIAQAAD